MVVLAFAEGGFIQLVPDGTILIHIALILLMIWVLNRTFFRPVNRVLQARDRHRAGGSEAQDILSQVNQKNSEYAETLRQARGESYALVESERSAALAEKQSRLEAAKAETAAALAEEKTSIQKQVAEARATLAAEAEKMADKISQNILK